MRAVARAIPFAGMRERDTEGAPAKRMKVVCAWCKREGRPCVLRDEPPLTDLRETHSICRRHLAALYAEMPSASFPGVRLLVVVAPRETALYHHLTQALAGVSGVTIIVDRRRGERRQERSDVAAERRRRERRIRACDVAVAGYALVRFGKPIGCQAVARPGILGGPPRQPDRGTDDESTS